MHTDTLVIHADGHLAEDSSLSPPIYYSATFSAQNAEEFAEIAGTEQPARYYTRYGNPLHKRAAEIIAALEGTEVAFVTGSGMGAISTAIFSLIQAGDHIVAQTQHYMGTSKLFSDMLPRFGVDVTLVDQTDTSAFEAAIQPNTKLIMVETPVNPTLQLTDLEAVSKLAKSRNILTMADNTFASPINQRPHDLGIDMVVHSATKYMGGHHDITAGVICTSSELMKAIWETHITLGSVLSPMDTWLLLRGLRTLTLRMERINHNAMALAEFLEQQPQIESVYYPGLPSHPQHALAQKQMTGYGAVIAFLTKGDYQATERFVAALKLPINAVSLGGLDTLVVHTAAMWAGTLNEAQMKVANIQPNMVRCSVGVEHIEDLKADILTALKVL
ncbi:MAG: aminotransferase class I/II-fold pyridoxal phosphate-dependent enzyme [Vampirovibrio sp.]|nr:aminotransferase class I/II-fold pyridoxal phosphate-dependent enzyme [Vampirovibrio sp.]